MGHLHFKVRDVEAHRKLWVDVLGGVPSKLGGMEMAAFPGVVVVWEKGEPAGGTDGSIIGHVGFRVRDVREVLAKARAAGIQIANRPGTFLSGGDEVLVELVQGRGLTTPAVFHHIHFYDTKVSETKTWYVRTLGATPGKRNNFEAADLPGVNLTFTPSETPTVGTKGRALDHIGFEVKNLEAFTKKLEAEGVKFDVPFRKEPSLGISLAFLTDPFGTSIELTEGMAPPPPPPGAVRFLPELKIWALDSARTTYLLGINEANELQSLYWGRRLPRLDGVGAAHLATTASSFESPEGMTAQEYPGWGGMRYAEPCLKVTLADGVRDLVLKYVSHEIREDSLSIRLKDVQYDLFVDLMYRVDPVTGILSKQARILNSTGQAVTVESAQSGVWNLPPGEGYRLSYLAGRWAGETQLIQEPVHRGIKVLESRRGDTSHELNPWFAIDERGRADEEHGRVWFGALGWSGNWKLAVEQTSNQLVRVTGGYNTFDFGYLLKPGESLETPLFYGGFSDRGFGEASRLMHRFEREAILPRRSSARQRPVLYNSWEATTFSVSEEGQRQLAEKAARIGAELFVMDDGWFGARNNDRAGLGDWVVNPQKFPHGLQPLIARVKELGMNFGLWVEPEMVNPDSDLYRAHPDWAIHFPGRPRSEGRNQLVLNLAREEVKEHIFGVLDKLLSENDIRFIKWDMNRPIAEPGWEDLPPAEQKRFWVKYVTNVYEIVDRLRTKHPTLEIEACSGGGARVDLGILRRVEQVWTSDNTDAFDRLRIQDGFSYAYAPKVMMAWVTDVPNMNQRSTPLQYRFLAAMMGSLGIGANLNHWSEQDFALATRMIAYYKSIRATVQEGDLYRLFSPREDGLTANQYVAADGKQSVVFVFQHAQQFNRPAPTVYLNGLDENALYRIQPIDDKLVERPPVASGGWLAQHGLRFRLRGDFDSSSVLLEKLP
jgi:alpha-galactosidase